jgi:long-chain acyl-CoA synthetase
LKFIACGGAKMHEYSAKIVSMMGFTVIEGYGLTETSPVVTFNPLKRQKIGSVGVVIPDVELRIANPDKNGGGEVIIKGPNVMRGYYKQEEETRKVLKQEWFYSGDLGYLDKQGYLYLSGRKKELIVLSSGKNISPEEVESYYAKSLFIKELCVLVIGEREEKLMAVIVPDFDYFRKVGEVSIYWKIKWDLENLSKQYPAYKRIMGFIVTKDPLPRTRLGELKRGVVKEEYMNELVGKGRRMVEKPQLTEDLRILLSEEGNKIVQILNRQTSIGRPIQPEDHLELDLGIDSLGRVEIMVEIEKIFNIDISDSLMAHIFTVKELVRIVVKLISDKEIKPQEAIPLYPSLKKIGLFPGMLAQILTVFLCGVLYGLFRIIWRLKIIGKVDLPVNERFILCPNHSSFMDGFLIAASVPAYFEKNMFLLGFRDYFEVPIIRNIIKLIRIIPIDSATRLIDAMQACAYVLNNGKAMCIFPEGARTIDGQIKEFKKGIGILVKELNVQLVPVYIRGTYEAWPRTAPFPRPYPISVIFGKPHDKEDLRKTGVKLGARNEYEAIAMGIREEVLKLKPICCDKN